MKNSIIKFLQFLFSNPGFFLKFKDTAFCNPAEHLYRTVKYIDIHRLNTFGSHIIDVGVADGATCNFFSEHFPNHKVVGFEPVKASFDFAVTKTKHNDRIKLNNMALSDSKGESFVHITKDSLSSSLNEIDYSQLADTENNYSEKFDKIESQRIMTSRMDDELTSVEKILLIKIDTQGTELTVFKGAIETLKRTKLILIEMNNHHLYKNSCQYYEVDDFLRLNNFILRDIYVTYRDKGVMKEYDALYINTQI